jgi:hypothetical protein
LLEKTETIPPTTSDPTCSGEVTGVDAETLRRDNQRLRNLLVAVATTVLKSIVRAKKDDGYTPSPIEDSFLLEKAEECLLVARSSNIGREVAESLEAAGHALLARAMELKISPVQLARQQQAPPKYPLSMETAPVNGTADKSGTNVQELEAAT